MQSQMHRCPCDLRLMDLLEQNQDRDNVSLAAVQQALRRPTTCASLMCDLLRGGGGDAAAAAAADVYFFCGPFQACKQSSLLDNSVLVGASGGKHIPNCVEAKISKDRILEFISQDQDLSEADIDQASWKHVVMQFLTIVFGVAFMGQVLGAVGMSGAKLLDCEQLAAKLLDRVCNPPSVLEMHELEHA